jgi:twitching motility protein PilT
MNITELLTFAVKQGASDAHLSSGEPPMLRIHGEIKRLDHPPLTRDEVHNMAFDVMSDMHRRLFQEKLDIDFSFELGDIARFRVNVFIQRKGEGVVFRTIPTTIVTLDELGMPPILKEVCKKERGLVLCTGALKSSNPALFGAAPVGAALAGAKLAAA